jgi:hypothetical protein
MLIFTVMGLALGESAMTGAAGVSRPTEDTWFTVRDTLSSDPWHWSR